MHLLMNHSLPGVNAGYITRNKLVGSHLRAAQQKISDCVMLALKQQKVVPDKWPFLPIRRMMSEPSMAKQYNGQ
jgi:hypothetical protein